MSETMSGTATDDGGEQDLIEEVAPAEHPEAPPAPEPRQDKQTVPLAVLMQEREELKRERAERQRLQEQFALGNQRLERLLAGVQERAAPPPEPVPDINTDPVAFFKHRDAQREREIAELREFKQQFEQRGQQQTQEQQLVGAYRADAAAFRAENPDFDPAYDHFRQTIFDMAIQAGATPDQANSEIVLQEQRLVQTALRNGKRPSEVVYNTSKKWGFQPPKADAGQKMQTLQRGQEAARPAAAGSRGRYEGLTVEGLAAMSEAEFAKIPEATIRKLLDPS